MDTDRFYDTLPREQSALRRRPWYVLAALLLLLSALTRQPILFFAAGFALVLGALPELWYRFALRSLAISHHLSQKRASFGEEVILSIQIDNRKWLPLPWVEIEDEIPSVVELLNGQVSPTYKPERNTLVNACSLWVFQRVTRRYHLRCLQRGKQVFGPSVVRSSDPFGWLLHEERLEARTTLVVYPLVAPLSSFGLPARHPFGEHATPQRLLEDPLRIAGVRTYQWGDEPRRINWKASARTGTLQSKLYEPADQHRLFLFLECKTFPESWLGIDPDLQELTISAAASLAHFALEEKYQVGLACNGYTPVANPASQHTLVTHVRVPMARGTRQQASILEALGQLITYFTLPLSEVIESERRALPYGTTVLLISPMPILEEKTLESLLELRRRGMVVHLALTGEKQHLPLASAAGLPIHWLGGKEVWHELVRAVSSSEEPQAEHAAHFHLE